jgi:hypothetical protein
MEVHVQTYVADLESLGALKALERAVIWAKHGVALLDLTNGDHIGWHWNLSLGCAAIDTDFSSPAGIQRLFEFRFSRKGMRNLLTKGIIATQPAPNPSLYVVYDTDNLEIPSEIVHEVIAHGSVEERKYHVVEIRRANHGYFKFAQTIHSSVMAWHGFMILQELKKPVQLQVKLAHAHYSETNPEKSRPS